MIKLNRGIIANIVYWVFTSHEYKSKRSYSSIRFFNNQFTNIYFLFIKFFYDYISTRVTK